MLMKIPTRILLGGILIVAGAAWCLHLLIPTGEWVHVGSCAIVPVVILMHAIWLAKRGSDVADAVMWMGVLVTLSYLPFARTVAAVAAP
ncbi:MAG: hypothetical protein R6X02_17320 [Enhygromyxa sp.]